MKGDANFVAKVALGVLLAGAVIAYGRNLPGIKQASLGFDGRRA